MGNLLLEAFENTGNGSFAVEANACPFFSFGGASKCMEFNGRQLEPIKVTVFLKAKAQECVDNYYGQHREDFVRGVALAMLGPSYIETVYISCSPIHSQMNGDHYELSVYLPADKYEVCSLFFSRQFKICPF